MLFREIAGDDETLLTGLVPLTWRRLTSTGSHAAFPGSFSFCGNSGPPAAETILGAGARKWGLKSGRLG